MERSVMGVDAFDNEITTQQVTTNEKVHILRAFAVDCP